MTVEEIKSFVDKATDVERILIAAYLRKKMQCDANLSIGEIPESLAESMVEAENGDLGDFE